MVMRDKSPINRRGLVNGRINAALEIPLSHSSTNVNIDREDVELLISMYILRHFILVAGPTARK